MRTFPILGSLVALCALFLPIVQAQSASPVSFRTLCVKYQDDIRSAYALSGKGGSIEVALYTGSLSEVYQGSFNDGIATLYVEDSSAPGGKRIVAAGKLASAPRQLFLLVPDPDKKHPYRIQCLPDDVRSFPMGGVRFVNLTPYNSRLRLAGATLPPVKPGSSQTYPKVVKVNEWNMYQAKIELQAPSGKWAPIASPAWKALDAKRDVVIATIDPRNRQPRILSYQDIPPWLEQPPTE